MSESELKSRSSNLDRSVGAWLQATGQTCEVVSVIAFGIAGFFSLTEVISHWISQKDGIIRYWVVVVTIFFGLLFLALAVLCSYGASKRKAGAKKRQRFRVTPLRIKTLKEVGLPRDAVGCLRKESRAEALTEEQLLGPLIAELGEVRVAEFKDLLLKYTRANDDLGVRSDAEKSEATSTDNSVLGVSSLA